MGGVSQTKHYISMEKLLIIIPLIAYSCSIDTDRVPDDICRDIYVNDTIKVRCINTQVNNLKYL